MDSIKRFLETDDGVTAVEYGLIIALIAIVIMGTLTVLGSNLSNMLEKIASFL